RIFPKGCDQGFVRYVHYTYPHWSIMVRFDHFIALWRSRPPSYV
ncbi:MAG: hypothetical protein ACI80I_003520, partial [Akkermansiaceae bacterium]